MQVALAGPDLHAEVRDAACGDLEDRNPRLEHVPVEDDAGVSPTLVRHEVVDDRVAAALLFAVAREAHVHRQRALGGEQRRCLQEQVQLALVVGDPARVEPSVAHRRLERRRVPAFERRGWLDVEVTVGDDGRRVVRILRGADLPDHEGMLLRRLELSLTASRADEVAHPLGGANDVGRRARDRR